MRNLVLKTLGIILLIFVLFPLGHAHAQFISGNDLVIYMREYEKDERGDTSASDIQASRYIGYVIGVYDAHRFLFDSPSGTSIGQVCAIVAKYLNEHPEKWNQTASDLVLEALKQAYPKNR